LVVGDASPHLRDGAVGVAAMRQMCSISRALV
jgi:hypothetical protein